MSGLNQDLIYYQKYTALKKDYDKLSVEYDIKCNELIEKN